MAIDLSRTSLQEEIVLDGVYKCFMHMLCGVQNHPPHFLDL
jgi:hypothetical protein